MADQPSYNILVILTVLTGPHFLLHRVDQTYLYDIIV